MPTSLFAISIDAHHAADLARFWAAVLHRPVADGATEQAASIPAVDDGSAVPLLLFHQVAEGKATKNRVHLDLISTDIDDEARRLIGLGATQKRALADNNDQWIGFADPEGNEFDLVAG
jgi:Glyoxalase-like domain